MAAGTSGRLDKTSVGAHCESTDEHRAGERRDHGAELGGHYHRKLYCVPKSLSRTNCGAGHLAAITNPRDAREEALVLLLRGWLCYADAHRESYESGIGEDGILGDGWAQIGTALLELLNGRLGRLDGGTIDRMLRWALSAEGFSEHR